MPITKKVVFFNDGTASVGQDAEPDNLLGHLYKYFVSDTDNLIWDMYKHCEEDHCYYFPGPATEICYSHQDRFYTKLFHTFGGILYGNFGAHGIDNTMAKIISILMELTQQFKEQHPNEEIELEIHLVGWSRGGFLNWILKKELARLAASGLINIKSLNIIYVDPVVGGPFDRYKFSNHAKSSDPEIEINSSIYYSHTGNLHNWFFRFNTPFFSALDPVDDKTKENSEAFMLYANHEEIVGKRGAEAGKLIRAHILNKSTLNFKAEWIEKAHKEGKEASKKMSSKDSTQFISTRAHLHPSPNACFFGSKRSLPWLTTVSSTTKTISNDQRFVEDNSKVLDDSEQNAEKSTSVTNKATVHL